MDRVVPPNSVDDLQPFTYGDLFYADTTSTIAKLPIGSEKNVLNVGSGAPAWTPNLEVTSVTASLRFLGPALRADSSSGVLIENTSGGDVALFGAGGGTGTTFYGGVILDAETASRIVTTGASKDLDTPAAISTAQSLTLTNASGITTLQAATQDAMQLLGRAGGTSSYIGTITPTTLTASRTYTFPDAAIVVSGSASALTSGRVPYVTTGGLLIDSSNLTFSGTLLTLGTGVSSGLTIAATTGTTLTVSSTTDSTSKDTGSIVTEGGAGFEKTVYIGDLLRALGSSGTNTVIEAGSNSKASSTYINMNAAAGQTRAFTFQSGGSFRWLVSCNNTAESGANAGSDFQINAYDDSGSLIDSPYTIARASGGTFTVVRPLTLSTASNGLTIAKTTGTTLTVSSTNDVAVNVAGGIKSIGATQGIGYATGAGGTVTQITSRTTGVTINKVCGQITLVSAAGSATWQSFTVTNSAVATTDVIKVCQDSGTDKYMIHVTAVGAGSFEITYATTGGTTSEQPVFNFSVIKAVTA